MAMFPGEGLVIITSHLLTAPKKDRYGQHMGLTFSEKANIKESRSLLQSGFRMRLSRLRNCGFRSLSRPLQRGIPIVSAELR